MADAKQDQGASEKIPNKGDDSQKPANQQKVNIPQGTVTVGKGKRAVEIVINPPNINYLSVASDPGAAAYRPGGKGGIVSHFDQFFGEYIAEQEKLSSLRSFSDFVEELELGYAEEFFDLEEDVEYEDWGEESEEAEVYAVIHEKKGPCWTGYEMIGMKKGKGGKPVPNCVPVKEESESGGRKVKLNKPFLTPGENKKRAVYVKNDKGNVVKVRFGDPNMRIRKSNPAAKKSFRARHGCDVNPGPKWKAKYWSCRAW